MPFRKESSLMNLSAKLCNGYRIPFGRFEDARHIIYVTKNAYSFWRPSLSECSKYILYILCIRCPVRKPAQTVHVGCRACFLTSRLKL